MSNTFYRGNNGLDDWVMTRDDRSYLEIFKEDQDRLLYLTADSKTPLDEVNEKDIIVIGGLIDRNQHKGLCQTRAMKNRLRTASFSIGDHMKLKASSVRTIRGYFVYLPRI